MSAVTAVLEQGPPTQLWFERATSRRHLVEKSNAWPCVIDLRQAIYLYIYVHKCIIVPPSVHLHHAQGMQQLPDAPVDPPSPTHHRPGQAQVMGAYKKGEPRHIATRWNPFNAQAFAIRFDLIRFVSIRFGSIRFGSTLGSPGWRLGTIDLSPLRLGECLAATSTWSGCSISLPIIMIYDIILRPVWD